MVGVLQWGSGRMGQRTLTSAGSRSTSTEDMLESLMEPALHSITRVKGMVFGQQVQDVRIEDCVIGGSETTGVHVTDSQVQLIGNFIHDNDYGVNVTGKSDIRLDRNIITRSLFEAIVVNDQAKAVLINNTLVKNGGGAAFLGSSTIEASGNILSLNKVGFLIAASSQTKTAYNALFNSDGNYVAGSQRVLAPGSG